MSDISIFYGITTTTLVVLSSTTLLVFKYFVDSVKSKAKLCKDSINELNNKEKICSTRILDVLGVNSVALRHKYKNISTDVNQEREHFLLFLVVFLSAISIFLTLLSGIFSLSLDIKWILFINLLSIIIYIFAFLRLLYSTFKKNKSLGILDSESKMFIKSIDDTNVLYRALSEKK